MVVPTVFAAAAVTIFAVFIWRFRVASSFWRVFTWRSVSAALLVTGILRSSGFHNFDRVFFSILAILSSVFSGLA